MAVLQHRRQAARGRLQRRNPRRCLRRL